MRVAVTQKRALAIQRLAASFVTGASQTVSVNAGPHSLRIPCATIGPASYAAPSALAESEGYI